jgi:hypothetical protein
VRPTIIYRTSYDVRAPIDQASPSPQAENEELSELGIEEVKDVREFIREVPLFQGMMQAEEVEGEWGFIEGTSMQSASTIWPHSLLAMR